ncbi:MAG: acyl transferase [Chitinophagaceae bacterium]
MRSKLFKLAEFYTTAEQFIKEVENGNFEEIALRLFQYQHANNALYQSYCNAVGCKADSVDSILKIPFLPISFFKTHQILTGNMATPSLVFESSGTTGEVPSRHYVADTILYEEALLAGFSAVLGAISEWTILGLLPSYLERGNSSLVYMVKRLMAKSAKPENGFYLDDWTKLGTTLEQLKASNKKVLLIGVTFALLDFSQAYPMDLSQFVVMETGGMKGRREEWTRVQVHEFLKAQWNLPRVATEYGMTELLSQAYALEGGILKPSCTMRVYRREENDPLSVLHTGRGVLNIVDLANVHSCAFLATEDLGIVHEDGSFEVSGRLDHTVLRGCSLMAI